MALMVSRSLRLPATISVLVRGSELMRRSMRFAPSAGAPVRVSSGRLGFCVLACPPKPACPPAWPVAVPLPVNSRRTSVSTSAASDFLSGKTLTNALAALTVSSSFTRDSMSAIVFSGAVTSRALMRTSEMMWTSSRKPDSTALPSRVLKKRRVVVLVVSPLVALPVSVPVAPPAPPARFCWLPCWPSAPCCGLRPPPPPTWTWPKPPAAVVPVAPWVPADAVVLGLTTAAKSACWRTAATSSEKALLSLITLTTLTAADSPVSSSRTMVATSAWSARPACTKTVLLLAFAKTRIWFCASCSPG